MGDNALIERKSMTANPIWMQRAIDLARAHMEAGDGGPFGAVIVRDNALVAEGWNCVTPSHDPTAHAEIVAIRRACGALGTFSLAGCEIYTSCEPCPMCLAAIWWARLDRLYYAGSREDAACAGFDDARLYEEMERPMQERAIPSTQLLRDEACAVFDAWIAKPDKTPY